MSFYVNAAIGVIWVMMCYLWFRNFPHEVKNITSKELQLIESNRRFSSSEHHIHWKIILQNKNLWALMLMYFCCQWANYFFVAWMPVYLLEGRHFTENAMKGIVFTLFVAGIVGFLAGGFVGDLMVKRKGLRFGRRFVGMVGLGICGLLIFLAAVLPQNNLVALCLIAANSFFSFGVMVSYAVCTDIGRNNAGTVTGAMNFFGQMGAFFLAIIFGKIVDATHNFDYPLFVVAAVMLTGCLLWLAVDPLKQVSLRKERIKQAAL
jgi:sugar phosphate permease